MKKIFISAFLSLVALASCKKPSNDGGISNMKFLNQTLGFIVPSIQNDMLVFQDRQHFEEYLVNYESYINNQFTKLPDDDSTTSIEDLIMAFEKARLSEFTSFRSKAVVDFEALNEIGWDKFEEVAEEHPFVDRYFESTLNQNRAVIIGDSINIYENLDVVVAFPKNELELYYTFLELPNSRRTTKEDIKEWVRSFNPEILTKVSILSPSEIGRLTNPGGSGGTGPVAVTQSENINIEHSIIQATCDPFSFKASIIIGKTKHSNHLRLGGATTIYWGDGTSTELREPAYNTPIPSGIKSHLYQNAGTYHPYAVINTYFTDNVGIPFSLETNTIYFGEVIVDGTLNSYCEDETMKEKNQTVSSADGKAKIKCKLIGRSSGWANNIQAETEFWKKKNNGKWSKEKTDKYKRIYAKVMGRLSLTVCGEWEDKSKEDVETNKKSAFAIDRYGYGSSVLFNSVKSRHYAYYGNEMLELNLELPKCP